MGCWNETCLMSNLPIMAGEKVAMMLLSNRFADVNYGPTGVLTEHDDVWAPICFPIIGEYDDYGGIENVKETEFHDKYFKSYVPFYTYDYRNNTYTKYEYTTFQEFCDSVTREGLYVKSYKDESYVFVEHAFIHYELYENLYFEVGSRKPYGKDMPYAECVRRKIKKSLEKYFSLNEERRQYETFLRFYDPYSTGYYNPLNYVVKQTKECPGEEIIEEMVRYIVWKQVMTKARQGYFSICGRGSQCREMYLHKIIADFITKYCEKYIEKHKESCTKEYENKSDEEFLRETIMFWDE